jgi:DNA-binding NtrC family response regulator
MMAAGPVIDVIDLPPYLQGWAESEHGPVHPIEQSLEGQERILVQRALTAAHGNQSQAARDLQISRDRLRFMIKKFGLDDKPRRAVSE